ncbi:MAG: helix-turn-helix transcriptional regulator [Bacilli bacterium]|nr:helix-turn-helix transcriptional regulator [Bacilli bacterium]
MTIEIADRLIKLRKKHGLSQEELADKLGLSRQAVSKWERAEASPDTDNLICLAKLYGVSLDELLSTDDDVETIVKEQVKTEAKEEKGDSIVLTDDDGSRVVIKDNHIRCVDKNVNEVEKHQDKFTKIVGLIDCCLTTLMIVLYILLANFSKTFTWANGWVFFFVPDFVCSILRAIHKGNPNKVNVVFLSLFVFFFVCMVVPGLDAHLWHPMWMVFLLIPVYHSIFGTINKIRGKEEDKD